MVLSGEECPDDPIELLSRWHAELPPHVETGRTRELTLQEVADALADEDPHLDAASMHRELLDRLRIAMINAVVDAEMVTGGMDMRMDAAGLQARIEGEVPMSLVEYAHAYCAIPRREP